MEHRHQHQHKVVKTSADESAEIDRNVAAFAEPKKNESVAQDARRVRQHRAERSGAPFGESIDMVNRTGGDSVRSAFNACRSGVGQQVPHRQEMEAAFGRDFSNVQAHVGQQAAMGALHANAATSGRDVVFASATPDRELVAHELTHVVQQAQHGVGMQAKSALGEAGDAAEQEADRTASLVVAGQSLGEITAPSSAAIQCQFAPDGFRVATEGVNDTWRAALAELLTTYNVLSAKEATTETHVHARFAKLDTIERKANNVLRDVNEGLSKEARYAIFAILSEAEKEHKALTETTLTNSLPMWFGDNTGDARTIWESVLNQQGSLKIDGLDKDSPSAFDTRVLSAIAQLLQQRHGRALVKDLDGSDERGGDMNVVISKDLSDAWDSEKHGGKDGPSTTSVTSTKYMNDASVNPQDQSGSQVLFLDDKSNPDNYGVDEFGEEAYASGYVRLGHELGHAKHNLHGTNRGGHWPRVDRLLGEEEQEQELDRQRKWGNPEEEFNIGTVENEIRQDRGGPTVMYHKSHKALRKEAIRHKLTKDVSRIWRHIVTEKDRRWAAHDKKSTKRNKKAADSLNVIYNGDLHPGVKLIPDINKANVLDEGVVEELEREIALLVEAHRGIARRFRIRV